MAAVFPNSVRNYSAQQDLVNTIIADNVNSLQEEVKQIETVLGSAATAQNILVSTWAGSFSQALTWGTLYDRIANIEAGLINGVATAPYVLTTGGSTITSSVVNLTLKTSTGTANTFEVRSSNNILGFNTDASGLPKVGTANVVYVGGTDYTTLTAATAAASTSAAAKVPLSTVTASGDLIIGSGSATVGRLGIGVDKQSLIVNGSVIAWGVPTDTTKIPLGTVTTAGDLIVGSGAASVSRLALGGSGQVLTSNGTAVTWATPNTAYVAQSNGTVTAASTSLGVVRNVWTSTSAPSSGQGSDGDLWVVYQ
jgi:hypothetical protein